MLVNFVNVTDGKILELGMGDYSTPIVHYMCTKNKREIYSYESKPDWFAQFKEFNTDWHRILLVDDWDKVPIENNGIWSVAFVDHAPGERRIVDIARLREHCHFVIVHDSQEPGYKYEPYFKSYKYRYDYKRYDTETTVISNFFNPKDYL